VRYRTVPKFTFRDWQGMEWRIRRGQSLRSPTFRWRIEQRREARWVLRALAPTRKLAKERMGTIWNREEAAVGTDS
jgi:hypothetical protein